MPSSQYGGSSGPTGRSPFPASRNQRSRNNSTSANGLGTGIGAIPSSLGGDSGSSRSSAAVGARFHYGNPLIISGMSSFTPTAGGDAAMEVSSLSLPIHNIHQEHSDSHHSPAFHGMLRFSPNNYHGNTSSNSWSPMHRSTSVTNAGRPTRQRFSESAGTRTNDTKDFLSRSNHKAIEAHSAIEEVRDESLHSKESNDADTQEDKDELAIDGIPINNLRALSTQALLQSPETAVFYSNILYSKTGEISDAILLSKAHYAAEQYSSCLHVLDEANALQQAHPWEAVLVACLALQSRRNWVALAEMLEGICRIPEAYNTLGRAVRNKNSDGPTFRSVFLPSTVLEDDDNEGWFQLRQFVDAAILKKGSNSQITNCNIHPIAQICYFRGLAYYETSCISRSATFWKRAIQMDCQCQMAWEALWKRNLLNPLEALDWITNEVTFRPHQDWLRSLYLARIELTPQDTKCIALKNLSDQEHNMERVDKNIHPLNLPGSSILDASSIHITSPITSFLTPGGVANGMLDDESHHDPLHEEENDNNPVAIGGRIQNEIKTAFDKLLYSYKLQHAPQVLALCARKAFRSYDFMKALRYCEDLIQLDPTVAEVAFCYVSTLVVLGHKRTLFRIAHEWVEASPKSARAWFAVGGYYYCIQRYHVAQRHFCRATRLDPHCTDAWIAFGCSFAACDESDQALASYRAAQRLSPGEHTSLLYMGMEYVRTNHIVLASHFLESSLAASGGDPLCLHELGVIAAHKGDHNSAIQWYLRALRSVVTVDSGDEISLSNVVDLMQNHYWEPTLFNLGHSYRKSRKFEDAETCYRRCIGLCPVKYSPFAALAFTKQLVGDLDAAISYFHQALSIKADDSFSTEMLTRALQDQTTACRQRIFDVAKPKSMPPPLTEATNFTAKESSKLKQQSPSVSVFYSPNMSIISSSRLKDDKSSIMSEEMDCDFDLSATS
jgi:tetratricopeptide (TPR) repeat protein